MLFRSIRFDSPAHPLWPCAAEAPREWLMCDAATLRTDLRRDGRIVCDWQNPLEALNWLGSDAAFGGDASARWAGYISYDLGRLFESLPATSTGDLPVPVFAFAKVRQNSGSQLTPVDPVTNRMLARSNFHRNEYERAVQRVIDYIGAGDVYQVNLSRRLTVETREPAARVYARLQTQSPAAFGALLEFDGFSILSNSPELFFEVRPQRDGRRTITSRPIKGTRPTGTGMYDQLLNSSKDAAELAMIVDLQRNDLGRVCEIGSVRVTEPRRIESHPAIYHGVATIEGALRGDATLGDVLRAVFPCGSITGCPKIRAMQIIEEIEPVRRGAYCGAIGHVDADGSMQFSVAIRTMTMTDGLAVVPVGGGIVADSTPASEFEETVVKSRAMLAALGAEPG